MGQYYALINLDKKQWIHAHQIGNGLKIGEQTGWKYSTEAAGRLLIQEEKDPDNPTIGLWAGDSRIAFVGDYGEISPLGELPVDAAFETGKMNTYDQRHDPEWTEISGAIREMMCQKFGIKYEGDGWLTIIEPESGKVRPNMNPDIYLSVKR